MTQRREPMSFLRFTSFPYGSSSRAEKEWRITVSSRTLKRFMQQRLYRSLAAIVCVLSCAMAVAVSLCLSGAAVHTEDLNRDGQPDVWRVYDRQGQLAKVSVDTNFDGRSDVQEYYEGSALVRRESDRDFNDRVDFVQEFDPATGEHERSIVDVDFDGTADLLVLFQGGQPVFSKQVHLVAPAAVSADAALHAEAPPRTADDQLAPLEDPFRTDLAVRAVRVVGSDDCVGLSTSGGLPASCAATVSPLAFSSDAAGSSCPDPSSATVIHSPRGPPVSHLLG
jgi:hypothetical protein